MKNRIRLLATSDVHGYIYPYDYADQSEAEYGLARLNTLITSLRDENTLLIDNGDILEGSPLSFYHFHEHKDDVSPMTKVLDAMEYDFINLGNHDFNYGEEVLLRHLDNMHAPLLTGNVLYKGKPLGLTYAVKELAGKKIVLFGVVTHYIPNWEKKQNIKHFKFPDALETAKKTVDLIRRLEKPDYIIGVYHGGFERDLKTGQPTEDLTGENQGYEMLRQIQGLDVLITGHQHRTLAGEAFGTVYTQTADKGLELACIDIYTDTGAIEPRILKADTPADPELEALVQVEEDECQVWLDQPLGETKTDLAVRDEFDARLHKCSLISFINHVQMEATGAQLSGTALFLGASGFGHSITMRNLVSTYVYPNTLTVKKITGAILKAYLEKCAEFWTIKGEHIAVSSRYEYPKPQHYNYDMLDGVSYEIHVSNDIGNRIQNLTYQGKPVTDDMEFTLVINNYRAAGGGDFYMLKDAPTVRVYTSDMVEVLAEYIMSRLIIEFTPEDNIRVMR